MTRLLFVLIGVFVLLGQVGNVVSILVFTKAAQNHSFYYHQVQLSLTDAL